MKYYFNKECGNIFDYNGKGKAAMLAECLALYGTTTCWRTHYKVINYD